MSADPMPIKALAPWFGGKRTLAPRIVAQLGRHTSYWEPFAGGVSVVMAKPRSRMETINDLHGDVVNLARIVQDDNLAPKLFERVARTLFCEDLYRDAAASLDADVGDKPDLDRAYRYLVVSWMGRSGMAGLRTSESTFCVRFTTGGGDPGVRFARVAESIPAWWDRLRGVTVLRRDGFSLLDDLEPEPGLVIYLDPPYVRKSVSYRHDFAEAGGLFGDDHKRLRNSLEKFRAAIGVRVVVSYYDCPEVRELYRGWTFDECAMNKATAQSARRGETDSSAPEVLILNGPSYSVGGAA